MFQGLTAVAAQTEEYAQRFRDLGTPEDKVTVTDTMKWDTVKLADEVEGAEDLRAAMGIDPRRPLVVAGSTGPGEEKLLVGNRPEGVQLMLVPRKPERFEEVARLAPGMVRRTERPDGSHAQAASDLFLLDTMGELTKAYSLADVAVVGRSFVPLGGSDPIEAVALGKPTIIGPRHENFRDVVNALKEGGGIRVAEQPMAAVKELLDSPDQARDMAHAGREVIQTRQGATERHAKLLLDLVGEGGVAGEGGSVAGDRGAPAGGEKGQDGGGPAGTQPPRKRIRRILLSLFALYMAAGYLTTAFTRVDVPPGVAPVTPLPTPERNLLSGVFSVHTERSHDAWGTREQVGAAASKAGLDFVIIGDHPPDDRRPGWELWDPRFYDGVLLGGGVELRAPGVGKILAMEVDSTYRRWESDLDSFFQFLEEQDAPAMVVHARGPRGSERWDHEEIGGIQGFEVLDISEFSRARLGGPWSVYHFTTALVGFPFGLADEALLHTLREGFETPTVAAYDSLRSERTLTATAGLNVHPKLRLGPLLLPSYGPFFRTLVSHLAVEQSLGPDPEGAQDAIGEGIERGELFISLGDDPGARRFRLMAVEGDGTLVPMGANFSFEAGTVLRGGLETGSRKLVYRILRDGREADWVLGPELEWEVPGPGIYRVEAYTYSARLGGLFFRLRPWIFANPIGLLEGSGGAEELGEPESAENRAGARVEPMEVPTT
jgi:hypothetical protein